MHPTPLFTFKQAPFLRILVPFISGIIFQHYAHPSAFTGWLLLSFALLILFSFPLLPIQLQFRHQWCQGIAINLLIIAVAMLFTFYQDIRHQSHWIGNTISPPSLPAQPGSPYHSDTAIIATLEEPLSEKPRSWKALASAQYLLINDALLPVHGSILIYFKKDNTLPTLHYGDQILFTQPLQAIRNTGNPGSFDYNNFCGLQGIYHQVFLQSHQFSLLPPKKAPFLSHSSFKQFLFQTREKILSVLRTYISGKKEAGLAEALLIGYKDDLDKNLIQSYSATGVVHVIAISGLHLGIIYLLLNFLCKPLGKKTGFRWLQLPLIIAGLWLFTLLAGATPSVLRSAVMFSCLAIGNHFSKQSTIYNSLAASAFLLLCYHPFWLWDPGFQLSYMAVLSLAIFMKPIYQSLSIKNPLLDLFWKLNATTIAAQILTIPICLYYFHQFPLLFLITNLVAVPLSSFILLGELLLCGLSFIPFMAKAIGTLLYYLIWYMNHFIEQVHQLSFAAIENISLNLWQVFLLYGSIAAIAIWLFQKNRKAILVGILLAGCFVSIHSWNAWKAAQQQQLIIYHVSDHTAMDFMQGKQYVFKGDPIFLQNPLLTGQHLQPARTLYRVSQADQLNHLYHSGNLYFFGDTSILLINPDFLQAYPHLPTIAHRIPIDLLVISGNPSLQLHQITAAFNIKQVVIDGSNSPGKTARWYQDCLQAGLCCHVTAYQGAFVLNGY